MPYPEWNPAPKPNAGQTTPTFTPLPPPQYEKCHTVLALLNSLALCVIYDT